MFSTGWLVMALGWGGFLAVIVWAVLRLFPASRPGPGTPLPPGGERDAGGLLDQRLPAGEIGEDDYLRPRGTLHAQR